MLAEPNRLVLVLTVFLTLASAATCTSHADTELNRPRISATHVSKAPAIDGKLDDSCWNGSSYFSNYIIANIGDEALAKNQTESMILYDENFLYLGVRCFDNNMRNIKANIKADSLDGDLWLDDCIEVFLDTERKREKYYHLIVNPVGAVYDAGPEKDLSWTSQTKVATGKNGEYWVVEMAIPFANLKRKAPAYGDLWGVNLTRHRNSTRRELSSLAYIGFGGFHSPERFADLVFIPSSIPSLNIVSPGRLGGGEDKILCGITNQSKNNAAIKLSISTVSGTEQDSVAQEIRPRTKAGLTLKYHNWNSVGWLALDYYCGPELINRFVYPVRAIDLLKKDGNYTVKLNLPEKVLKESSATFAVKNIDGKEICNRKFAQAIPDEIQIQQELSSGNNMSTCKLLLDMSDATGKEYAKFEYSASSEIVRDYSRPAPKPVTQETERGYYIFRRCEPGEVYPVTVPARKDIVESLNMTAARGERCGESFALHAIRDIPDLKIKCGEFVNEKTGEKIDSGIELYSVKSWPQRLSWNTKQYHIIPELMEKKSSLLLKASTSQLYYFTFNVPEDTKPGTYKAEFVLSVGTGEEQKLEVTLQVMPFLLAEPPAIIWGLYPDSQRWKNYSSEKIYSIMKAIREQGINSLIMYPFRHGTVSYSDGEVKINLKQFNEMIRFYRKLNYSEPFVLSLQSMDYRIRKWLPNAVDENDNYTEIGKTVYTKILELLKKDAETNGWPRFVVHTDDEPHEGNTEAVRTMRLVKNFGFETFTTWPESDWANDNLSPYVDYRCYCNINYNSLPTRRQTDILRRSTWRHGGVFWYYGSGCYGLQDGNIINNRFLCGLFFWKSGATGEWSWTFNRPKDDPFNDLDGEKHGEAKDACIVYDAVDESGPFIPTLQWEGIREGINDYRYYYTLNRLLQTFRESGVPEKVHLAIKVERKFKAMTEALPWRHADRGNYPSGLITNETLDKCRKNVAQWIIELKEKQ